MKCYKTSYLQNLCFSHWYHCWVVPGWRHLLLDLHWQPWLVPQRRSPEAGQVDRTRHWHILHCHCCCCHSPPLHQRCSPRHPLHLRRSHCSPSTSTPGAGGGRALRRVSAGGPLVLPSWALLKWPALIWDPHFVAASVQRLPACTLAPVACTGPTLHHLRCGCGPFQTCAEISPGVQPLQSTKKSDKLAFNISCSSTWDGNYQLILNSRSLSSGFHLSVK